ncbi:MAG: hypothetical protein AB8B63_18735, partial [Granulosicoccus sp.]
MIDEDLYQKAADELNSDRRRPHIWARACALASDDQDEARYLYTNLRVEELLAERATLSEQGSVEPETLDATLAIEPSGEAVTGDFSDTVGEFSAFLEEENIPQAPDSFTSSQNSTGSRGYNDSTSVLDAGGLDSTSTQPSRENNDVVPDASPLDDTYAGLENPTEVFQKELEKLKAEQGGVNIFESTAAFSRHLDGHIDDEKKPSQFAVGDMPADVDSDNDSDFHLDPAEIDRLASLDTTTSPYSEQPLVEDSEQTKQAEADLQLEPTDTDAATTIFSGSENQPDALKTPEPETPEPVSAIDELFTEADYQPTDNSAGNDGKGAGVEEILANAVYKPAAEPGHSEGNLDWLDEEPIVARESDNKREPLIINDDSLEATLDASFFAIEAKQESSELAESPQPEEAESEAGISDAESIEIENSEFDQTARTGSGIEWPEAEADNQAPDAFVETSIESPLTQEPVNLSVSPAQSDITETDISESDIAGSIQSVDSTLTETLAMTEAQLDGVHSTNLPQPETVADELTEALPPKEAPVEPSLDGPQEDPSLDGRLEFPTTIDQLTEPSLHGNLSEQPVESFSSESSLVDGLNEPRDPSETDIALDIPASEVGTAPASLQANLDSSPLDSSSSDKPVERPSLHERSSSTAKESAEPLPETLSLEEPPDTHSYTQPPVAPGMNEHAENASEQENRLQAPNAEVPLETPSFELPQVDPAFDNVVENTPEQSLSLEEPLDTTSLDTAVPTVEKDEHSAALAVKDSSIPSSDSAIDLAEEIHNAVADQSGQLSIEPTIDTETVDESKAAFAALAAQSASTSAAQPATSEKARGQDVVPGSRATSKPEFTEALATGSFPVDLTDGTDGKQYAIYHRRGKTQIVSTRGSWT